VRPLLNQGIGRGRFLAAGLALFALKVLIDYGVALAFSRPYTPSPI